MQSWGWNAELWVCQAGTLPTERQTQLLLLACHHSNLETGLRAWPVFLLGSLFTLAESINEQMPLTFTGQKAELQLPERCTGLSVQQGPPGYPDPCRGPQTLGAAGPAGQGNRQFPGPLCTYPDEGFRGPNGRAGTGSGRAQPAQPVPCSSRGRPPGLCHLPGISVFPSAGLEEKTIIRSLGRRQRGCGTGQWRPVGQAKGLGGPRVLPHPLQHCRMQEGALRSPPCTLGPSFHCIDLVPSASNSDPGMKKKKKKGSREREGGCWEAGKRQKQAVASQGVCWAHGCRPWH